MVAFSVVSVCVWVVFGMIIVKDVLAMFRKTAISRQRVASKLQNRAPLDPDDQYLSESIGFCNFESIL